MVNFSKSHVYFILRLSMCYIPQLSLSSFQTSNSEFDHQMITPADTQTLDETSVSSDLEAKKRGFLDPSQPTYRGRSCRMGYSELPAWNQYSTLEAKEQVLSREYASLSIYLYIKVSQTLQQFDLFYKFVYRVIQSQCQNVFGKTTW